MTENDVYNSWSETGFSENIYNKEPGGRKLSNYGIINKDAIYNEVDEGPQHEQHDEDNHDQSQLETTQKDRNTEFRRGSFFPVQRANSLKPSRKSRSVREDKPDTHNVATILSRFVERASLPGVVFVYTSVSTCAKAVWAFLLVLMVGVLSAHVYYLADSFMSYPKHTQVSLGFDTLGFPAVTFCNLNPARMSKIKFASEEIQALVKETEPYSLVEQMLLNSPALQKLTADLKENGYEDVLNKGVDQVDDLFKSKKKKKKTVKRDTGDSPQSGASIEVVRNDEEINQPETGQTPKKVVDILTNIFRFKRAFFNKIPDVIDDVLQENNDGESDGGGDGDGGDVSDVDVTNSNFTRNLNLENVTITSFNKNTTNISAEINTTTRSSATNSVNTTEPVSNITTAAPGNQSEPSDEDNEPTNQMNFLNSINVDENLRKAAEKEVNSAVDTFHQTSSASNLVDNFRYIYAMEERSLRMRIGHQIEDMLVDCAFGGGRCYPSNFSIRTSNIYGNCYTFDYETLASRRSGPGSGLTLVLFLERDEFLHGLTSGIGGHVVIHGKKTFPFPGQDGLAVASGMEVDIGLRMVRVSRLPKPHGDCTYGEDFFRELGITFTRNACQHVCEQSLVMGICGCYDNQLDELHIFYNKSRAKADRVCSTKEDFQCMHRVQLGYLAKELECDCRDPCNEVVYTKTISLRQWPSDEYSNVLISALCERVSQQKCLEYQLMDKRRFGQNFIKLNVFYEDLNYENVTELPSYELIQFCADIGGALGLSLGLSVMTLLEIGHLLVSLFRHFTSTAFKRKDGARKINSERA